MDMDETFAADASEASSDNSDDENGIPKGPEGYQHRLDLRIGEAESELNKFQTGVRWRWVIMISIILVCSLAGYVVPLINPSIPELKNLQLTIPLGIGIGIVFASITHTWMQFRIGEMQSDLDLLNSRKLIVSRLGTSTAATTASADSKREQNSPTYFDSLVRINVENLAAYYSLMKVHTDNSFRVSLWSGVLGFLLVVAGLVMGLVKDQSNQTVAVIAAASGVVIEFISGVFFYLYNKTVIRLKEYHDSLLAVQNILLTFKIIGDTTNDVERSRMTSELIGYLIGKKVLPASPTSEETS